jgi:hypothetical protein
MDSRYKSGLFLAAMFIICIRLFTSCTVCFECKPKGSSEDTPALEVCQRDEEEKADFDVRVNRIRKEGYECK